MAGCGRVRGSWVCTGIVCCKAVDLLWELPGRLDDTKDGVGILENLGSVDWSDWVLAALFGIGLVLMAADLRAGRSLWRSGLSSRFDMSIDDAILHVLGHDPSTFRSRLDPAMNAFRSIHRLAGARCIELAGSSGEGIPPRRIPAWLLLNLSPVDLVLPVSHEAPEAHVYVLASGSADNPIIGYRNILVSSKDLFRYWPEIKP